MEDGEEHAGEEEGSSESDDNGDGDDNGHSGDDAPDGAPARAAGAGAGDAAAELERLIALADAEIQLAPEAADAEDAVVYNRIVAEKEIALSQAPTQPLASQKK